MGKIVKKNLSDQIFDYIQGEIIKGVWKPGDRLPSENDLANMLGVSRMSLRNGIQRCNAVGLTETRVGEGTFVRNFSLRSYFCELYRMQMLGRDPNEINDLRFILQIGSVRLAIANGISDSDIAVLETLFDQMKQAADNNDMDAFHDLDFQFHRSICELCKNELIYMLYDAMEYLVDDITRENVLRSIQYSNGFDNVISHHRNLLDSLKNRDFEKFVSTETTSRNRSLQFYQDSLTK